ncbi:MAG: thiol reductant ABC exporter subunit CydC [Desulfobacterales bacterium]|nr:MAG: thiol reductant ABC exporter subunit CydC [Desulfobacterales bacterium]
MPERKHAFRPFLRLLLLHWQRMALGTFLGLTSIAAAVGLLALSGWFISAAAYAGLTAATAPLFNFFYPSIGVRLFAMGRTAARYAERIVCHDATFRILESLRTWFYRHLEPLAPACLMSHRSGDILSRIVADIEALDNLYLRVLSPSVIALLMLIMVALFLGLFDPFTALIGLACLTTAGLVVPALAAKSGAPAGRRIARQTGELQTRMVDGLQGLPELLVFDAYPRHLETLQDHNRALVQTQRRMSHIRGLSTAGITLLSGLAVFAALYRGAGLVNRGELHGASLALIVLAVMASFEAVLSLPAAYQYLGRTREAARRLREIVDTPPAVTFPAQSASFRSRSLDVRFENVSFSYQATAPCAVREVDFQVSAGQRVALLGETGSGKTTLVHLLVRFWDPTHGRILIGGQDIRTLSEPDLRRHICVVSQQAHLFNASLKDNLRLARPAAATEELRAALDAAQLLDFVDGLAEGLETWIGEAGRLLSGGQARRLAVARAILQDAPIWVLDEPTEGLDTITARQLMHALYELTAQRTVLLITHQPVDLHRMDKIVLLENGRLLAHGSPESLQRTNPRYAAWQARLF